MQNEPSDPNFADRVRESFDRQTIMKTMAATLTAVEPGFVSISMPFDARFGQQHGFVHAGAVATIADSANGYAAFSLMPADAAVLAVEFKINLLAPAVGDQFVAEGRVIRPGRRLSTCQADVFAITEQGSKRIAVMLGTMMCVRDNASITH